MIGFSDSGDDQLQNLTSVQLDASARITRNKGRERVGKVVYKISKVSIFADGLSGSNFNKKNVRNQSDELDVLCALPNFRFNRLVKPVHWERLKGLNLDRSVTCDIWIHDILKVFTTLVEYIESSKHYNLLHDFWIISLPIRQTNSYRAN